jgi:hypothetical protein
MPRRDSISRPMNSRAKTVPRKHAVMATDQGPILWFLKYFRRKIWRKYWRFLLKNTASFWKTMIITLVFEKKAIFLADNGQKSQKIVSITSTPRFVATFERQHQFDCPAVSCGQSICIKLGSKEKRDWPWRHGLCRGIVSACHRGGWSYGSWDRIPPGRLLWKNRYLHWHQIFKRCQENACACACAM